MLKTVRKWLAGIFNRESSPSYTLSREVHDDTTAKERIYVETPSMQETIQMFNEARQR